MHIHLPRLVLASFVLALALSARAGIGVTVNGVDIAAGSGAGWTFVGSALSLTGAGPYVISGSNGTNNVSIAAAADCAVVASNLTVDVSAFSGVTAFDCGTSAVSLSLVGANRFASGSYRAGIHVPPDATLAIATAPDATEASLCVTGGVNAAGIGGNYGQTTGEGCGAVRIGGGEIAVAGGKWGAGIGGGDGEGSTSTNGGAGGTVTITGGRVSIVVSSSTTSAGAATAARAARSRFRAARSSRRVRTPRISVRASAPPAERPSSPAAASSPRTGRSM